MHTPLTDETRDLLDADAFARMQDGVLIVNAARGGVIDTQALIDALDSGKVYAAGLDVTAPEPLDPDHTLLRRDNVVVTPHIASATDKGRIRMYSGAIENARQVLAGERPLTVSIPMSTKFWRDVPRECTQEDPGWRRRLRWMGQAHTRSILRIPTLFPEREFDAELVMISDNMASRVDQAVADFGFGHGSVDWNDLIANDDIDVVVICAPNMLHEPIAIAAAEAGKHVFCEKPVGGTPEQTVRIEAATRAAGVITGVGYNYRWAPLVQYAKQLIDAGELGEITNYRGRFFRCTAPIRWVCFRGASCSTRPAMACRRTFSAIRSTSPTC